MKSEINHSHKKRKDSLETQAVLLIFSLELKVLCYLQNEKILVIFLQNEYIISGGSQDLNWRLQDIAQNLTMMSLLSRWRHYRDTTKNMNNFKNCTISLNMLHSDGLCGVLGFTAPLISISKKFQSKYIYTLSSALRALLAWAAIKQLLAW